MKWHQKTYNNILYFNDDKVILKDKQDYYNIELSSKALLNNSILNKELFITEYLTQLKKHHLSKFLWHKNILIITNFIYPCNEKKILKETFRELGYKQISIKPIESILKINKEDYYLLNGSILRLLYIDDLNQKSFLELDSKQFTKEEISMLLKNRCHDKRLFILNEDENILSIMESLKLNYYYFDKQKKIF